MSFSSNGLRGFVSRKLKLIKSILSRPGTGWLSPFFGQLAKAASLPAQVAHPAILGAFLFPKQRGKSKKNGTSFFCGGRSITPGHRKERVRKGFYPFSVFC